MSDSEIDKILFEHKGDERLLNVLNRLGIDPPTGENWPIQLKDTGLFSLSGKPDYLELTPFGKEVKGKGGWIAYQQGLAQSEADVIEEKKLDREIKELTARQLRLSIWQIRGWWWLLVISFIVTLLTSNFELILKLLGVLE